MINFNPKQAAIFQAIKLGKYFKLVKSLKKIFVFVFIICFVLFAYGFSFEVFDKNLQSFLLGLSIVSLSFIICFQILEWFFNLKLKNPPIEETNLASFLNYDAAEAVYMAMGFSKKRKLPQISSEAMLYFCLKGKDPKINFIFTRAGLNLKQIREELKNYLNNLKKEKYQERFSENFLKVKKKIGIGDILISQSQISPIFKKHLIETGLKTEDIENLVWWAESLEERIKERKKFWEYNNLIKLGSIGSDWAAGYTLSLDEFSIDWTEAIKKHGFRKIIGHKAEIKQIERILSTSEINNVLLVGKPGSGRKTLIQALVINSFLGTSLPALNHKRIVELDLASLITETGSIDEMEKILEKIFEESVSAGNVVLIINNFDNFIGQDARPGAMDISGVLERYLHLPNFQIIAITSFVGLHRFIEPNPSILNLFEKVELSELSEQKVIRILEERVLSLEQKYKKFVTYPALRDIVSLSARYIPDIPFPQKAIELLNEAMIYASRFPKKPIVTPQYVNKVISEKTQIPIGKVEIKEKETLLNLENLIHQRIINQEEAVKEVSSALRRARADIRIKKGPMGSFLFLGPTGVGKTETSKAIAEIYFKSEKRMIRLDMSEFQNIEDIHRLLGNSTEEGLLTMPVREDPFSLVLLDEIEKAHRNILNLFLQVTDEGHITDGLGRKINFSNTIIIATSNAGADIIWEDIRLDKELDIIKEDLLSHLFKEKIFRPEFINRFDATVIFKPLTKENLKDIAELLLEKLRKNLAKKDIEFIATEPLASKIAELGYKPSFGARPMRRVIQDKIEDELAEAILSGKLKRGHRVQVNPQNFSLSIDK
ncbi:ATP-dependent Clp protease ATP-binding subunit [Candidatus Parcubacteria bacterium]|nr:ATP-dependent Clp protease ATP-binding subunit [Candidatus Parcubacteria bacterium]